METRWGLDLDMSAVRLLRRNDESWDEIAVEKIDGPDIEDRLTTMLSQIEPGAEAVLFLPRDQILYTSVDLPPVGETRAEIERAMDGRTPYSLDELALDWELVQSGRAVVAAIAHETLDEAAAFAEVRGIGVAGYSSLDIGDEFPRMPQFEGPYIPSATAPDPVPASSDQDVVFTTARKPSRPPTPPVPPEEKPVAEVEAHPPPADKPVAEEAVSARVEAQDAEPSAQPAAADEVKAESTLILKPQPGRSIEVPDGPVVKVDDSRPVMEVKSPQQPLNPGVPVSAPAAPPRVRTDIAASTVSGRAATLTPPGGSLKVRRTGSFGATAMIFAAVFLLTVGIATLVWMLLPLSPGRTDPNELPPAAQSGQSENAERAQTDVADAPTPLPEAAPEPLEQAEEPVVAALPEDEIDDPSPEEAATPEASEPTPENESAPSETALPEIPDAPQPDALTELAVALPPVGDDTPFVPGAMEASPSKKAPELAASAERDAQPAYDPQAPLPATPSGFATILTVSPYPGPEPDTAESTDDIYFASIEGSDLASDAIALPSIFALTAEPLPSVSGAPSADPTDTPEVAAVQPEVEPSQDGDVSDAMAAAVAEALADALAGPGGLIPTALASSVPETAPRPRPGGFVETIERDQFGGRTRQEMQTLRPAARPESVQTAATTPSTPPSELAVAVSLSPRLRPDNFAALVTAARVQREAERLSAAVNTRAPDTISAIQAALDEEPQPQRRQTRQLNIPTTASVARQATIENAIRLNQVNLVGVYGAVSNRRALVRLPSGRYVKVKVGDRVDGGTVAQITDSELLYRKGNRTLSLSMPKG